MKLIFPKSAHRQRVVRNIWMVLPMPAEVISTVHQLASACKNTKASNSSKKTAIS